MGRHSGSFDDVASSADSEPIKWNANAIAVISRRNQKSQNLAFNSSDAPKREAIRYETNGSIDAKDARNVRRIGFCIKIRIKTVTLAF